MGHLTGKRLYRALGHKVDGLSVRVPWNETLYALLKELYSEADAELIVKLPYGLAPLARLERVTGMAQSELLPRLESLCSRGLVFDLTVNGSTYYGPSPMVIGIFEFTMMRSGVPHDKLARLFAEYNERSFFDANFGAAQRVSIARAVPHEGTVVPDEHVEVLDYEKATALVEQADRYAVGICSCRHEKEHLGHRTCQVPLEGCSTLGALSVDYLVRHGLAREVSQTEMLENVARSRELGLVICADNVKRGVGFLCHCCGCCCNMLGGISRFGYTNTVVTSSYVARVRSDLCNGCRACSDACPIQAIARLSDPDPRFRKHGRPSVDQNVCIGCGVCALKCKTGALGLVPREKRVLHPETTFERVILQSLERGTLQNQLFDEPENKTHAFLRGLVGGFLRLAPVKQALMSDTLRSRFLAAMKQGAKRLGKSEFVDV
ncbi:MAG: 4Fe-4S binding protein [Polyangiaceae bacterium]|nr:4Fe-4S binding protein [Polyangiaceae bacterium]